MTLHNYGDISSETHSNDKRANEESHPSESTETITARRCTEGEASSEQDSRQDIQENRIEGGISMFPMSASVIPVMDNRSYTPRLLSARGSVIMTSIRPMLQAVLPVMNECIFVPLIVFISLRPPDIHYRDNIAIMT